MKRGPRSEYRNGAFFFGYLCRITVRVSAYIKLVNTTYASAFSARVFLDGHDVYTAIAG